MTEKPPSNKKEIKEENLTLDVGTIVCGIIGAIISWINMWIMDQTQLLSQNDYLKIFAYLSIIFTTSIPCIAIGLKNRLWGYGYILGFACAGIPFIFLNDLFIGAYTFATTIFIFIIMWLIFWKGWRSLSAIEIGE